MTARCIDFMWRRLHALGACRHVGHVRDEWLVDAGHCLNRLVYKRGGGFTFALVRDPIGHEHRVHKDCLRYVLGDGIKEVVAPC